MRRNNIKIKERPIVFSDEMVRAILEGRKNQTRRVLKPQPLEDDPPLACEWYTPAIFGANGELRDGRYDVFGAYGHEWGVKCPYGAPGDCLWVREAFTLSDADCQAWDLPEARAAHEPLVFYRADVEGPLPDVKWNPSVHMPKDFSRITLKITSVRVERLQKISEEDAKAEGAHYYDGRGIWHSGWRHDLKDVHANARSSFARYWDETNKPGRRWSDSPWVWVIEFKRVKP